MSGAITTLPLDLSLPHSRTNQMMQNLISRHTESGYAEDGSVWWGTAVDGSRMMNLIESSDGGASPL